MITCRTCTSRFLLKIDVYEILTLGTKFGQLLFDFRVLVPEFVGSVDCEPGRQTSDNGQREERCDAQVLGRGVGCSAEKADVMQRHTSIGDVPIVLVHETAQKPTPGCHWYKSHKTRQVRRIIELRIG